jgi:hypothetical protein
MTPERLLIATLAFLAGLVYAVVTQRERLREVSQSTRALRLYTNSKTQRGA